MKSIRFNDHQSHHQGYTLIEVIVALSVFTVLAMLSSGLLSKAFDAQKTLHTKTEPMSELNLALEIIKQDTSQMVLRETFDANLQKSPYFKAEARQIEFTRGGYVPIPGALNPTTLRHIAYVCRDQQLVRLSWPQLDRFDRIKAHQQILIQNLKTCSFSFVSERNWADHWEPQDKQDAPKAFQLHLGFNRLGSAKFIFIIPNEAPDAEQSG